MKGFDSPLSDQKTKKQGGTKKVPVGICLFAVVAIIIATISFAIGYCKYRYNWQGRGSCLIPMLVLIALAYYGLSQTQNLIWYWFVAVMILGIVFFFKGDHLAFKETMREKEEKQRSIEAAQAKQLDREKLPVLHRVVDVIEDYFGIRIDSTTGKAPLLTAYETQPLGDVTGSIELAIGLEDEFGLKIPNEDADSWKTVSDIVEYINQRLASSE